MSKMERLVFPPKAPSLCTFSISFNNSVLRPVERVITLECVMILEKFLHIGD